MIDSKFICTLVAMVVGVAAICNFEKKKDIRENYAGLVGMPFSRKMDGGQVKTGKSTQFFQSPNLQATLSPRIMNLNLPAQIKYNPPSSANMAAKSCEPVILSKMAQENYVPSIRHQRKNIRENYSSCGGDKGCSGLPNCPYMSTNAQPMAANYRAGAANWQAAGGPSTTANGCGLSNESNLSPSGDIQLALPAQTMSSIAAATGDASDAASVVMMDRLMVSLPQKRGIALGDWIRGDLPIVPHCNDMWRPTQSFDPGNVLNPGAMAVLGAGGNVEGGMLSTPAATAALITASKGGPDLSGATSAIQGMPMSTFANTMVDPNSFNNAMLTASPINVVQGISQSVTGTAGESVNAFTGPPPLQGRPLAAMGSLSSA